MASLNYGNFTWSAPNAERCTALRTDCFARIRIHQQVTGYQGLVYIFYGQESDDNQKPKFNTTSFRYTIK